MLSRTPRLILFVLVGSSYTLAAGYAANQLAVKAAGPSIPGLGIPYHENQETGLLVGAVAFPVLSAPLLLFRGAFRRWTGRNPVPYLAGIFACLCLPYYLALRWLFG
jgi:hypothetical protein